MTTLTNSIVIDAPCDQVWGILANLAELAEYDPAVATSTVTSATTTGPGASRAVTMRDGKHWFKERVTAFEPMEELAFELTSCNFPIARLRHTYAFAQTGGQTTVTQSMSYSPKFGVLGKLIDLAVLRRNSDRGIKAFMSGLKAHAERRSEPAGTAGR